MARTGLVAALAVLVVSWFGCGGGGDGGLEPPGQLAIGQGATFDMVQVTWTEPGGAVDGYDLEGRVGGGPWESLSATLIRPGTIGVVGELDPSVPELVMLGVRIRSARGDARSAWSAEATMQRGVRPPSALQASLDRVPSGAWSIPPVHLGWMNGSLVATALQLERAPTSGPGAGLFAPVAALGPAVTGHDDPDVSEGAWTYRLRAGTGDVWSTWAEVVTDTVDVAPPRALVVALEPGGVRLDWTNRSTLAEQLVARLDPGGGEWLLATLPVGTNGYLDAGAAPWPATRYSVGAVIPAGPSAGGPAVAVGALTLHGPLTLSGTARLAPDAAHTAWTDGGLLHAATWNPCAIHRDLGAAWERHDLAGANGFALPAVLADEAGRPHTVVYRGYPDGPTTTLVHEWHDGAGWREEVMMTAPGPDATFGLGSGGALHVLASRRETTGLYTTVHLVAAGGFVTSTDVLATTLPPPPDVAPYYEIARSLSVASDGTAYVALTYSAPPLADTRFVLFRRSAAGAWEEALAPFYGSIGHATVAAGSAGAAALLYDRYEAGDVRKKALLRTTGGWAPEETVTEPSSGMDVLGAALAPDGVRLHVLLKHYPDGLWLSARGAGGWATMKLGSPPPQLTARTGFTADGRATVVVPHGLETGTQAWVSLLVEPP